MADNQLLEDNDVDGGDIFVYTGGEQRVPLDVKRVRIAENVDTIPAMTFLDCIQLIEVVGHEKLKKIERSAFYECTSLRSVTKMTCVIEIGEYAFNNCSALSELEFDKLEIIGHGAFDHCKSLKSINMTSARRVCFGAFDGCDALTDVVFGQDLEIIEGYAFHDCTTLRSIFIPLKENLIIGNSAIILRSITIPLKDSLIIGNSAFDYCVNLSRVDTLVGQIHKTISSLHMETWKNEMQDEIDRINQTLPNIRATRTEKATAIQQWIARVLSRMAHYKSEHKVLLKEAMALLELALWKAKLLNETDDQKKCTVDEVTKKEHRVTCGASIVIKNVLPFLALK